MKNTRFRDFSRVGRKNGCATNEKGGRKGPVSRQKPRPPFLCSIRLSRGGVGRSASVRGSPFGRGGAEKAETEEARRETIRDFGGLVLAARIYRRRPFTPWWTSIDDESGGRAWVGGGRTGGRKLLFHLRLRQLGKTAAPVCFLITKERE